MPTVRSSGLLREIAISPCASGRFQQIGRFRREAVDAWLAAGEKKTLDKAGSGLA